MLYDFKKIEKKWQKKWHDAKIFKFDPFSTKEKYYVLEMLPYPSGNLHMGHVRNYTIGDIIARYKKMKGFSVIHPMGWDAFGLPAENAAIEHDIHPEKWTMENISHMKKQLMIIGFSYDWDMEIITCNESYYQHEQKIFIEFFKKGIVYQKESIVNWDPVDNTILANEQVVDGKGWRSGAIVEKKTMKQWFLKISEYAEELLSDLDQLNWPEKVKSMQRQWIGRSSGAEIDFICNNGYKIKIFTSRPETIFGASFIALSYSHPLACELSKNNPNIVNFIKKCNIGGVSEEELSKKEKLGFDTGLVATLKIENINITVPVFIANFIFMDYGTGAIFGCPEHDERDSEFANKYNLNRIKVIDNNEKLINSHLLNNLSVADARLKIIEYITSNSLGNAKINNRLKDWGVSRQRYWGCPIPLVYCDQCGIVPEKNLPVLLPKNINVKCENLANNLDWIKCKCPSCGKDAKRETDTLDTFFESSWYFLRYISAQNKEQAFEKEIVNKFLPIDNYIGGIEHAVMHLLYARFFVKALRDCGYLNFNEPFKSLLTQGMVCHAAYKNVNGKWLSPNEVAKKDDVFIEISTNKEVEYCGVIKMSKSKKNTVDPVSILNLYGADTTRFFMVSDTPPDKDLEWNTDVIESMFKYLSKLYKLSILCKNKKIEKEDKNAKDKLTVAVHLAIKDVEISINTNIFNKMISSIRQLSNIIESVIDLTDCQDAMNILCLLIAPTTPHLAEEMWKNLGNKDFISNHKWPEFDEKKLETKTINLAVQINGKLRAVISVNNNATEEECISVAIENNNIKQHIVSSNIKKRIFIKNKILNFII